MKVLFDQNMPRPLARFLTQHQVSTAADMGWERLKNGDLLNAAEANGFDVLVTADQNLAYQQNLENRKLALVVLPYGRWPKVRPHISEIIQAVDHAVPGSYLAIPSPRQRNR